MNKKVVFILVLLMFCLGAVEGYYLHDTKDQVSIVNEANKIIKEQYNYNKINYSESIYCTCSNTTNTTGD